MTRDVDSTQILPVVIGGLVTLTVTFIVQVFVVPPVQAALRRRERWEADVRELAAILEEQLGRALRGYRSAAHGVAIVRPFLDNPNYHQEKVEALLRADEAELREADKVVGDLMSRMRILESRVGSLRPYAATWDILHRKVAMLRIAVQAADLYGPKFADEYNEERWEEKWAEVWRRLEDLKQTVAMFTLKMKPPPRRLIHRARRRLLSLNPWSRSWGKGSHLA